MQGDEQQESAAHVADATDGDVAMEAAGGVVGDAPIESESGKQGKRWKIRLPRRGFLLLKLTQADTVA
jgi:hypothetical protein